jgi:hypothetical protein
MKELFGVKAGELTAQGRSQAYYYGKELKIRHPHITESDFAIYSSKAHRTVESAKYFMLGWYGIRNTHNGSYFKAMPNFLPPCRLSFVPRADSSFIDIDLHKKKLEILNNDVVKGGNCLPAKYPIKSPR